MSMTPTTLTHTHCTHTLPCPHRSPRPLRSTRSSRLARSSRTSSTACRTTRSRSSCSRRPSLATLRTLSPTCPRRSAGGPSTTTSTSSLVRVSATSLFSSSGRPTMPTSATR
ncbi:hypothetical protein VHUM_04106 [Vanrija humicola]|uniref:Uncharacterized protein n=1 Tax=Vanrija humicola TaxID=5417 RepID=A0A7D8UVP8_VANHU|nr:hypothetical protein VHUM_04106 [Vanrija humicola]